MVCFDIYDVEDYNLTENFKNIDNLIKESITLKYKDRNKLLECIKIMYFFLKSKNIIENDNIFNYIYPSSELMTIKVLIECSNETEKIHVDNLKIGDIIEKTDIDKREKEYYKIVKLDELNVYYRKLKINRLHEKKISVINTYETNKKTEHIKKTLIEAFFSLGFKRLNKEKGHLNIIRSLIFKNFVLANN